MYGNVWQSDAELWKTSLAGTSHDQKGGAPAANEVVCLSIRLFTLIHCIRHSGQHLLQVGPLLEDSQW